MLMSTTAVTCGNCEEPIPADGPSPDFCDEDCQSLWHFRHGEPLALLPQPTTLPPEVTAGIRDQLAAFTAALRPVSHLLHRRRPTRPPT